MINTSKICLYTKLCKTKHFNSKFIFSFRNQQGGLRRAYMGHLIRMANYVVDFGKQGKNATKIQQLIENLPDELRNRWADFVENKVVPANRNNEIIPVTVQPTNDFVTLDTLTNLHLPFPVSHGSTPCQL